MIAYLNTVFQRESDSIYRCQTLAIRGEVNASTVGHQMTRIYTFLFAQEISGLHLLDGTQVTIGHLNGVIVG